MALFSYSIRKMWKGDPTTVSQLRDDMVEKLKGWKSKGTFLFSLQTAADKDAALVISSGDVLAKKYAPLASPMKKGEQLFGTYAAIEKPPTFEFKVGDSVKPEVCEAIILDPAFRNKFWALLPPSTMKVTVAYKGKKGPASVSFTDPAAAGTKTEKTLIFNLTKELACAGSKDSTLAGPPLSGVSPYDAKASQFVTKGGLVFPKEYEVTVSVHGRILKDAVEDPLFAQKLHDPVVEIYKQMAEVLKAELIEIDAKAAAALTKIDAKDKKKIAAEQEKAASKGNEKVIVFQRELQAQAEEAFLNVWYSLAQVRIERRAYELAVGIDLAKGTLMTALGVATAVVGGVTGVGAVLGVIGTLKDAAALLANVRKAFQDVHSLAEDINTALRELTRQYASGAAWKDFGKAALKELPVAGEFLASTAPDTWTFDLLNKNIGTYKNKVLGLVVTAHKLSTDIPELMDKIAALAEDKRPPLEKKFDALIKKVIQMNADYTKGKDSHANYVRLSAELERLMQKPENTSKVADALKKYLVPLLGLPWGIDPEDAVTTGVTCGLAIIDLGAAAIEEMPDASEAKKAAAAWTVYVKDLGLASWGLGTA